MLKDINWNVDEINFKDYDLPQPQLLLLPDCPICHVLVKLYMQVPGLTEIPETFFEHMPMLEVLDLSNTKIESLPTSIVNLNLLQEFFLRDCSYLAELPTHVGMLSKLKLFDIKGTELMYIPKEMGKLKELEVLRISLSQYARYYIKSNRVSETVIPRDMIPELKQLKELCITISVGSEPQWWEEEVKYLQNELCALENLKTLTWYLPTSELLQQFLLLERNHVLIYTDLSNLMLTIGQHAQLTSCLPHGLEKKFEELENCLKWINAEGSTGLISKIMTTSKALFLSRHWTIKKLSIVNITKLKYCLLVECNEMETVVEVDNVNNKVGLDMLQYLSIHHMNKLQSIWKGPISKDSLSKLRILALHTCPLLTSVFTLNIAQNLLCLTELNVENCPKVKRLISTETETNNMIFVSIFPRLEKIFLLGLPELEKILGCRTTLNKLSTLLIYNCLKLRSLDIEELPNLTKIEGDIVWWNKLDCDTSVWKNIFSPLGKGKALFERLFETRNSLLHFLTSVSHENDEKKSANLTDIREQVITADASTEKGKGMLFLPEDREDDELYGWSHSETPEITIDRELDPFSLSKQENDERKSSNLVNTEEQVITADMSMDKGKEIFIPPEGSRMLGVTKPKPRFKLSSIWMGAVAAAEALVPAVSPTFALLMATQSIVSTLMEKPKTFTMEEIYQATKNFSPALKVGQGGFGTVYKGQLQDGTVVAVKRVIKSKYDKNLGGEFDSELQTLLKVEHSNLVKCYGYFQNKDENIFVFEYVPNGTLREHLDCIKGNVLSLASRLGIAIDVAHAITYLHTYTENPLIHRDIKSSNILLTEKLRAKVADFGFTQLQSGQFDVSSLKGIMGYLDPEFLTTGQLTEKSDIYSFGILLLELVTGRRPIEVNRELKERVTARWVKEKFTTGFAISILDPNLEKSEGNGLVLEKILELALKCIDPDRRNRPTMIRCAEALWNLRT